MRRFFKRCLGLVSLMLCGATAAHALDAPERPLPYVPPDYIRKPPAIPEHLSRRNPRQMAISEAVETVLRNNLGLVLERERVHAADFARTSTLSIFEPTLQLSAGHTSSGNPPATAQEGQAGQILRSRNDFWNLRIAERLPTGTLLSLDFTNTRAESSLGNAVAPLLYRSSLSVGLVQPLLRDFSFDARIQLAPILRAEFDSEAARETARLRAMATVKQTEDAYWSLVESWKALEVNRIAQELAENQLELTRRQIAAGVLPESDIISVEGTLAQRQVGVVTAEAQIESAADTLRQLLNLPPGEWDQPLVPLDAPSFSRIEITLAAGLERAMQSRPELKQAQLDLRRVALDLEVAKNQRLPRLNLQSNLGTVGQDEDYRRALDQVGNRSGWQWTTGVDFAWAPLGIGARADVSRLQAVLRQSGLGREQLLVDIRAQLRAAMRDLDTAERQLYALAKSRDLAERSLDVEQRRFLNGLSNNFMVAQRQADLAQARLGELRALIQHEKAGSALQLAMGELLEARRLHFEVKAGS